MSNDTECRYPCGCEQFPEEHCSCMDGHAPPTDRMPVRSRLTEGQREELIEAVQNGNEAEWVESLLDAVVAERIGGLCVLGSDDPQAVASECLRIAREGGR